MDTLAGTYTYITTLSDLTHSMYTYHCMYTYTFYARGIDPTSRCEICALLIDKKFLVQRGKGKAHAIQVQDRYIYLYMYRYCTAHTQESVITFCHTVAPNHFYAVQFLFCSGFGKIGCENKNLMRGHTDWLDLYISTTNSKQFLLSLQVSTEEFFLR